MDLGERGGVARVHPGGAGPDRSRYPGHHRPDRDSSTLTGVGFSSLPQGGENPVFWQSPIR